MATATERREYTTEDKSEWGPGPWQDEPDKVQWVDEATGLDCLMVRNSAGTWCGYVGVGPDHPWHGIDYSACIMGEDCDEDPERYYCDHRPDGIVRVHGGLTFASACQEPTEEEWSKIGDRIADPSLLAEAEKYPTGDASRRLDELRRQEDMSLEEWAEYQQARRICHVPAAGRPDNVWWFGFDCAHAGDLCPAYAARFGGSFASEYETYKARGYVEGEVRALAKQLAAVEVTADA